MDHNSVSMDCDLWKLQNNEAEYTIEQVIRELESTRTLNKLSVCFYQYEPTPTNNRRFIEPLCRCISNLRLQNAQHPLRSLILTELWLDKNDIMEGVFAQFLVAAKQFGIFHIQLAAASCIPIQLLVEFCRDNDSLEVLELEALSFSDRAAALPLQMNNGPPNNSFTLPLEELVLCDIKFENSTAATAFANLLNQTIDVAELRFGKVTACNNDGVVPARNNNDEEEDEDNDNDTQITERILSELQVPSAEQLILCAQCRMQHFKAALDAGTTTVADLTVCIDFGEDDKTALLESLASFVLRAVRLINLTILRFSSIGPQMSLPPQLFQALESCATVIKIDGFRNEDFIDSENDDDLSPDLSPDEVQQLQKITSRNRELYRFATNPGTYLIAALPELMRQFDSCPTGRYMLARRLPEVLSFAELYAMRLSRRRTNLPTPKKSKLE